MINKQTQLRKDIPNKKIFVTREFDGPVDQVWKAWTDSSLLDQWWAPKPWKAETTSMDFREGGVWYYSMVGPDGTRHFCRVDYESIAPGKSFTGIDAFCDENGNINTDLPVMHWKIVFGESNGGTKVDVEITFDTAEDLEKILEMGFQEGFALAHSNLDELLAK